jgi:hypothetical protein
MKQQHLLFFAMAILVLYSLIFQQEEKYQSHISSNYIKIAEAKNTQKQIVLPKLETIKFQLMKTEPYIYTTLEITAKPIIQFENNNFILPTF